VAGALSAARSSRAEDVTVVGSRPSAARDRDSATTVIPQERLEGAGTTAADVLRAQPGVAVRETGGYGSLSTASIRGATAAQTPVYLAGIRLNDDLGGTADLSLIPLWLVRRVEVYRSATPEEADRLGLGGAIFFEPRRARGWDARGGLLVGSFGTAATYLRAGVGDERAGALVGLRLEGAQNDYELTDDRGTRFDPGDDRVVRRQNADAQTYDAWTVGHAQLGRAASVDLLSQVVAREQGIPSLSLFPTERARARLSRELFGVTSRVAASDRVLVTTTTAAAVTRAHYTDPLREAGIGGARSDVAAARGDQGLSARIDVTDDVEVVPVLRASLESLAIDADDAHVARASRAFARGGLSTTVRPTDALRLRALASLECHGTQATGTSLVGGGSIARSDTCGIAVPAGRASAAWGGPALTLLANAGRYGRAPTLGEMYGISGVVRGNADLAAERGWAFDAGVRSEAPRTAPAPLRGAWLDAFVFVRFANDLVAYRRSALGYVRPYNEGTARVAGAELGVGGRPLSFLTVESALTLLDPRSTSTTTTSTLLPYQSQLVSYSRVGVEARPRSRIEPIARAALSFRAESARHADQAGLVVIPAQGSLDAEGALSVYKDRVTFRLRAVNLLGQERFDVVGYPLPGRAFYASLEAEL
jgi:iron complex outermembrane receptor protein